MAKSSPFPNAPRDLYQTQACGVAPLIGQLTRHGHMRVVDPCAGAGNIAFYLAALRALTPHDVEAVGQYDVRPLAPHIEQMDARHMSSSHVAGADAFVTNPPWSRRLLDPLMAHLYGLAPTWLLLPLDHAANAWFAPHMEHCLEVHPTPRLRWFEPTVGHDDVYTRNTAWFLFDAEAEGGTMIFPARKRRL